MAVGILLVGGFGTRLKPLTNESPKPMLPVAGIPVTEHQIMAAKKAGIHTLVLATSYLAEVFTPYFGDGSKWGISIKYAVEKEPLGTGGAIRHDAELLGRDEDIVIFNGDVLSRHNIASQIAFHQKVQADVTLHLIRVEDARAFGCVPMDSSGKVTAFLEKMDNPITNLINAGCYVFSPQVLEQIPLHEVVSVERQTFPALVAAGRPIYGFEDQSYWLDVGTPAALFQGSRDLIKGDFQSMSGCEIARDARIFGKSSIGARCRIESGVEIEDCIIGDDVVIGAGAKLSHTFVAHGAVVSAGGSHLNRYISRSENLPISG
jgi:mannose-1-phosphate guanylyltransferase